MCFQFRPYCQLSAPTTTRDKIALEWNQLLKENLIKKCTMLVYGKAQHLGSHSRGKTRNTYLLVQVVSRNLKVSRTSTFTGRKLDAERHYGV